MGATRYAGRTEIRERKIPIDGSLVRELRLRLRTNPYWKSLPDDAFETDSLREAAQFRKLADKKVERIFQRTFQVHYPETPLPDSLLKILDAHQIEGIAWILTRKRSCLAHAPGAGKTAEAILAGCFARDEGQSVFIVPPSLTLNWEREIRKVTGWIDRWPSIGMVRTWDRQEEVAWKADFLIVPDSMLAKPWVYERLSKLRMKLLAVDEASRLKECTSERSIAFYGGRMKDTSYRGLFQEARHVVFLDGSPMPNRPMELWAPTYALCPEAIGLHEHERFRVSVLRRPAERTRRMGI